VPDLWTPIPEGPHEAFVERLHRTIAHFAEAKGVEAPVVVVELSDGSRFVLDKVEPEPGFGLVTLYVHGTDGDTPDAVVVPIGSMRRIELRATPDERGSFGFAVPPTSG
jgi:hypothetical protein